MKLRVMLHAGSLQSAVPELEGTDDRDAKRAYRLKVVAVSEKCLSSKTVSSSAEVPANFENGRSSANRVVGK